MMANILQTICVLSWLFGAAFSLKCLTCDNFELTTSSSIIKGLFDQKSKSNPQCSSAVPFSVDTVDCPDGSNVMCGYVQGTVEGSNFLGSFKAKTAVRGCVVAPPGAETSCYENTDSAKNLVNAALSFLTGFSTKVDGKICYCAADGCDAQACGDGSVVIADFCVQWWMFLVGAGALLVLILVFTCCCCCCCTCGPCAKSRSNTQGQIIHVNTPTPYTAMEYPNQVHGMENPGYGHATSPNVEMKGIV